MTLDDVSFTTKFAIHSGGDVTQVRDAPRYGFPPNLPPTSRLGTYAFGSGIYLIRAGGLNAPSSPLPGVGLGGLVPRTESAVLGGLPFTSAGYCDFRTQGPHMRIDDLPVLRGDSSLVFLHPSPPSIAALAATGRCLQPTTIRFGFRRTHRSWHGLRNSHCCHDGRRPADSFKESYTGD